MEFDPTIWRRKSIRLKGYDYTQAGAYFITMCIQNRECRLGEIVGGVVRLNGAGEIILSNWQALQSRFPSIIPDEFVVMPNHVHGILIFGDSVGAGLVPARDIPSLADIIRVFKSLTTDAYIKSVKVSLLPEFHGHLWQRNYYERILRNDIELTKAREYIRDNPIRWEEDEENPFKTKL